MLQSEKVCPILSSEADKTDRNCLGNKCGWFRGDEKVPMNTDQKNPGQCAVMDLVGAMGSLVKLGKGEDV